MVTICANFYLLLIILLNLYTYLSHHVHDNLNPNDGSSPASVVIQFDCDCAREDGEWNGHQSVALPYIMFETGVLQDKCRIFNLLFFLFVLFYKESARLSLQSEFLNKMWICCVGNLCVLFFLYLSNWWWNFLKFC